MIDIDMFIYEGHKMGEFTITNTEYKDKEVFTEDVELKYVLDQLINYKEIFRNGKVLFFDTFLGKIYIKREFNFVSFFQVYFGSKDYYKAFYKKKKMTKEHLDYIIEGNDRFDNNTYNFTDLVFQCSIQEWDKVMKKFHKEYKKDLEKIYSL